MAKYALHLVALVTLLSCFTASQSQQLDEEQRPPLFPSVGLPSFLSRLQEAPSGSESDLNETSSPINSNNSSSSEIETPPSPHPVALPPEEENQQTEEATSATTIASVELPLTVAERRAKTAASLEYSNDPFSKVPFRTILTEHLANADINEAMEARNITDQTHNNETTTLTEESGHQVPPPPDGAHHPFETSPLPSIHETISPTAESDATSENNGTASTDKEGGTNETAAGPPVNVDMGVGIPGSFPFLQPEGIRDPYSPRYDGHYGSYSYGTPDGTFVFVKYPTAYQQFPYYQEPIQQPNNDFGPLTNVNEFWRNVFPINFRKLREQQQQEAQAANQLNWNYVTRFNHFFKK